MPSNYAVSRASILLPFLHTLHEQDKDTSNILKPLGLNKQTLENTQLYLPSYAMGHILDSSAYLSQTEDISFSVGNSDYIADIHPDVQSILSKEQSLVKTLFDIVQLQHLQGSHFSLDLDYNGTELKLYHSSALTKHNRGFAHSHIFTTARIMKFIRQHLGQQWQPTYLAFEPTFVPPKNLIENTASKRVLTGLSRSYVPISIDLEQQPLPARHHSVLEQTRNIEHIKHVIKILSHYEGFSLELVAHLFGISERTIQRQFVAEGHSFRDYFNQLKIEKAKALLVQGLNTTEVAEQLNYSDAANFTRAMKTHSGMTPSQYLSLLNQ
ncbi:AraC family transcriptional regulator [Vibrio sp. FNV 38]|nr:AraC family transcriptional regulator [Vibrio sp. FNV 38]